MMNNGLNNSYYSIPNGLATTPTTSSSSTSQPTVTNSQSQGLKTYFKTPEGRYKLRYEKTRPPGLASSSPGKSASKATLAQVRDKPVHVSPVTSSSEITSASSGVRYAAAKLLGLGSGNGLRALSFLGGNGTSKTTNGTSRTGSFGGTSGSHTILNPNYDGKGTYLIFNVGDAICIGDLNSPDKEPIKLIYFSNSNPVCHAFDPEADGHDFLIGLSSGDVYSVSLRQQLQDVGKKLVGAQHYNRDGSVNNSRCTCFAWVPNGDGTFVAAHADGNLYVYEKGREGSVDYSFPIIRDQTQFSVTHARSSKSNPVARWHICQGSINSIAFSCDGTYLATVGRDGYLRVFDYSREQLVCGGKSYYGALLCCTWSGDGKYILTGGEDDLVSVWSMEDRKVVAWGEGHNSWVSAVAFDPYWSSPASDDAEETSVYRFGSVGLDAQLLLWDLSMEEIIVPLRRCTPGVSPTFSTSNQSSHWKSNYAVGTLQPAPSIRDVPKLSPVVAHRVHPEALSGIIFTQDSIITACREGHLKIWIRPDDADTQSNDSETHLGSNSKQQQHVPGKVGASSFK